VNVVPHTTLVGEEMDIVAEEVLVLCLGAMNTSSVNVIPKTSTKVDAVAEKVNVVENDFGVVGK
jgi:hypothetical protein